MPVRKHPIVLDNQQRQQLEAMVSKGTWQAREIKRARILLATNGGQITDTAIAIQEGYSQRSIYSIRKRFCLGGLEVAIFDAPRSGQPKRLSIEQEAYVIATACTNPPNGEDHWTLSLLQQRLIHRKKIRVCRETVRKVLLKNKLKPWLKKNMVHTHNNTQLHRKDE